MKSLILLFAFFGEHIELPREVRGSPGSFIKVPATTTGATVRWHAVDANLNLFPVELLRDTKTAVVIGMVPGRYKLLAWTAVNGEPTHAAECVVVIGDPPPVPPVPPPVPPPEPDPAPSPRPGGFAGEVYDQALRVPSPREIKVLHGVYLRTIDELKRVNPRTTEEYNTVIDDHNRRISEAKYDKAKWAAFAGWVSTRARDKVNSPPLFLQFLVDIEQGLFAAGGGK